MRIGRQLFKTRLLSRIFGRNSSSGSNANFVLSAGFSPFTSDADYKNKALLVMDNKEYLTYEQMNILSGKVAQCLTSKYTIKKGDFVLCRTSKTPEAVALYFAVLRLGAIYIPLNPSYTPRETKHFVDDAHPKLFVTSDLHGDSVFAGTVSKVQDERKLLQEAEQMDPLLDVETVQDTDMATMLYTSGTTGVPKGAMISHGALRSNAEASAACWRFTSDDVQLHTLPFYHIHGMFISFNCSLITKSTNIFLPKFSVSKVIKWLPQSSVFMGVPSYYGRLLESEEFTAKLLENFRLFVCGSAPLSPIIFQQFYQRTKFAILERYGMTEALVITSNPYEESERISGSVGKPITGVQLRVSKEVQIEVKSPGLFSGYWKLPEKTKAEFTSDGYFITGDMGEIDDEGNLRILGREKEMIISGGLNVYPKEVEEILDATGEVKESAVIGVPHSDFGEAVVAVCVLSTAYQTAQTSEEQLNRLRSKLRNQLRAQLAGYKIPKQFFFVSELPRNFLGKLQKHILKQEYQGTFEETKK